MGALLSQPTVSAAAESVGIGEATLRRWLKDPGFLAPYRGARRDTLEHCVALLQESGTSVVESPRAKPSELHPKRCGCAPPAPSWITR